jgi:hypothetical protein
MPLGSTYRAAKIIASSIEQIFLEHQELAESKGEPHLAQIPSASVIETIIDAAFWTSLRKEEGHSPRISLAYLSPEQAGNPIIFSQKIALSPQAIAKIAPGFERSGIHLGVWLENGVLFIWGATSIIPNYSFVIDVSEPGLVVIKHRRTDGFGKFSNIAVLTGDEIKIVDGYHSRISDTPDLLKALLDFTSPSMWNEPINVMLQLAVSIRAHKRGGTLLVVPSDSEEWRESIRHPLHYAIEPSFSGLARLVQMPEKDRDPDTWQIDLSREVDLIAGLTAIDGAIVMNDKYEILAFGEKITRPDLKALVEKVVFTEPINGGKSSIIFPAQTGGTRHLSAAQFVHDQPNSVALVASQDGRFTVYTWSSSQEMVQAHRIDSLLL